MTDSPSSSSTRLVEIDIGRGLAVFVLAIIHTLWMYADTETQSHSILGHVVHFIGKGTPAFLICMGISMVFSRKQDFRSIALRGVFILALAYGMNFLKFIVPISVFHTMPESFIEAYGWSSPLNGKQLTYLVLTGDILQMAGVALILMAVANALLKNKYAILAAAILIAAVSREVAGLRFGIPNTDYLAKLFFSGDYHVYFPVVPWMSFILFGMFIGKLLQEKHDTKAILARIWLPGVICLLLGGIACYINFDYHFGNFFNLGPGGVVYLLGINLLLLWAIHKFVNMGVQSRAHEFLHYLSQRVTSVYIIQWVLVCWGMGIIGFRTLNAWQTAGMMVVMLLLTFAVQRLVDKLRERKLNAPTLSPANP